MSSLRDKWHGRDWTLLRFVSFYSVSVLILGLISLAAAQNRTSNGTSSEYYYYDDTGDVNGTFSNSTGNSDEYFYYIEEVIIQPKNGSGLKPKVIHRNVSKGWTKGNRLLLQKEKGDVKGAASGHVPIEHIHGNELDTVIHPSVEPAKEVVTHLDLIGPTYTDRNYGIYDGYGNGIENSDVSLGGLHQQSGPSFQGNIYSYPENHFEEQNGPGLLRPPPLLVTESPPTGTLADPPVNDVEYIDGNGHQGHGHSHSHDTQIDIYHPPIYGEPEQGHDHHSHNILNENGYEDGHHDNVEPEKVKINTEFTLDSFGNTHRNPLVTAKTLLASAIAELSGVTTTDVILWAEKFFNLVAELSIPKEHYLRVISFAGIYLFITVLAYGKENLSNIQCSVESKNQPFRRWKYHAGRRFVPARSVDPHIQRKFLNLFHGIDDDDDDDSRSVSFSAGVSSEEDLDLNEDIQYISEMCPKDTFFYSLNPRHIEAYTSLQRIFVAQRSPEEVISLAKYLLYKEKVHPKVWYIAIIGSLLARQDMTGFSVAHPLDAIPDWYIPADLISDIMDNYKRLRRTTRSIVPYSYSRNTTFVKNKPLRYYSLKNKMKNDMKKKEKEEISKIKSEFGGKSPPFMNSTITAVSSKITYKPATTIAPVRTTPTPSLRTSVITTMTRAPARATTATKMKGTNKPAMVTTTPMAKIPGSATATSKVKNRNVTAAITTKTTIAPKKTGSATSVAGVKGPSPVLLPPAPLPLGDKGDKGQVAGKPIQIPRPGEAPPLLDYNVEEDDRQKKSKGKKKKGKKKKRRKGCIKVDWRVGIDNGIENELWYWREDIMMNQHHWYWHQTHPVNSTMHGDRRAELFFYMHRAFVARYNAERLSNGLARVVPLRFKPGEVIYEGYNSHLADINSGTYWTPRWQQTRLQDIFHEHDPDFALNISLRNYLRVYRELVRAIKSGMLISKHGEFVRIDHLRGIEPLTNTVEAADLSVNPMYYTPQGIHALGHLAIGLSADPDFRFRKATGVMSDAAVSMRDPSFYAYHLFLDNFFELHKQQLAPYRPVGGDFPLLWKGIELVKIELRSQAKGHPNELRTFWTHHNFELSPGVDRSVEKEKHSEICAQHLDHEPFYFKIVIDRKPCVKSKSGKGTIRIFMAPRYDEKGKRIPLKIQRRLMFPLDSFPVKLKVGRNTITRYAEDSSLTQPWTKSIRELQRGPDSSGAANFCGCGWPQHLYIPKGHAKGMAFDLFVMVTNYDEDYVPNDPKILEIPETCNSPYIFCGLPRRRYPDKRPMGYPFDRQLFRSLNCPPGWTFFSVLCKTLNAILHRPFDALEEYVKTVPNMGMLKFHIRHLDTFLPEPARH